MPDQNVFIAGHQGMVGSAILSCLKKREYTNLIVAERSQLDLTNQSQVQAFIGDLKIDQIYLAAAKVGGILANNSYPAEFIYNNIMIEANIIAAAQASNVPKLLFLGSSCIYPKFAKQPMAEEALLGGPLESTNEPYAIAKIAGIKLCESYNRQYGLDYRSVMPTNLYGPGDNFGLENSHVIPALLRRFDAAKLSGEKEIVIWGSGKQMREFLHVNDMADACVHVMELDRDILAQYTQPMLSHINIGSGTDCTIRELAETIARVVGFQGKLVFDSSKPDGAPRKLLDIKRLQAIGWRANITLEDGLRTTYQWFLENRQSLRT
ncbi:GDP-L-fucose synthase [Halomonas sp. HP20-15]|uniref:GDP-L-fucose synthase n=1 Tax=Halomonas sp. HP20-15 TaxID=3085901 RepID=UPI0029819E5D|nr:GDP-L-fucose synthase [Halomonas sp. HP20-15]MDW5377030.1 GDP-L-fucose synthase [Halomonas sp. HP20-15]